MGKWMRVAKSLGKDVEDIASKLASKPDEAEQVMQDLQAIRSAKRKVGGSVDTTGASKKAFLPEGEGRVVKTPYDQDASLNKFIEEMLTQHELSKEGLDPRSRMYVTSKRPFIVQDKVVMDNVPELTDSQFGDLLREADILTDDLSKKNIEARDVWGNLGVYEKGGSPVVVDSGEYINKNPSDMSVMNKIRAMDPDLIRRYLRDRK